MGFRFRLGKGLWINLSKTGGSLSVGGRGVTVNVSPRTPRDDLSARNGCQLSDLAPAKAVE